MEAVLVSNGEVLTFTRYTARCGLCRARVVPLVVHSCETGGKHLEARLFQVPTMAQLKSEMYDWLDYVSIWESR